MTSSEAPSFFIGVDGGGTRTRVRVIDTAGTLLSTAEGGPANLYLDRGKALAVLDDALERAMAVAGIGTARSHRIHIGFGLAGVSSAVIAADIEAAFAGRFAQCRVRHDGVIACLGAHAGGDGGLVIAGTGSAAVLRLDGRDVAFGGRGFLLGDDGSGAVMGRQAWRKALRAHDGLEPLTPLLLSMMARFDHDPVAVITWGRRATSAEYGNEAPLILAAAETGDAAARTLVGDAAAAIVELVDALAIRGAPRISLVGGLAAPLTPHLPDRILCQLAPPLHDALAGALFLAGAPTAGRRPEDR